MFLIFIIEILNNLVKMNYKNEFDYMPGIYKCYGDIKYSRFKVRLEVIKTSMIPLSDVEEQETGLDPQFNEREKLIFSWNEKIFNSREFKYYSDIHNCHTELEREYYDKIEKLSNSVTSTSNRLFTYTSKDNIPTYLHRNILYKGECYKSSYQKDTLSSIFQNFHISSEKSIDNHPFSVRNIVDNNPSNQLKAQNRSLMSGYETMYIVADLSDKNLNSDVSPKDTSEHLLVSIKWNKKTRTLIVIPDFASFKTSGYKIDFDTISDTRCVYRYWILNISKTDEQNYFEKLEKLTDKLTSHQSNLTLHLNFEIPYKDVLDIYLFIEIQKAVGFTYDNLFIQYFVHLPSGWSTDSSQSLSGITQQCRFGKISNEAVFSFLFELKLSTNVLEINRNNEEKCSFLTAPQLFFEICSLDSWRRLRVEGYTWMALPTTTGRHQLILHTWRPAPLSRKDDLRRFFIGADPQILDFTYSGIPAKQSNNLLSRYGFETVSSGYICLELNVLHQTGKALSPCTKNSLLLDKLKTTTLMNNVNHILEAFKKARQRMLLAREPILLHTD